MHHFWGLISEQSIEALHHRVNEDERRYASIRKREDIQKKILEQSFIRNVLHDLKLSEEFGNMLFDVSY